MLRLACDVGGTFTDLAVASGGKFKLFKAPTTPGDPAEGVFAAIRLAAEDWGVDVAAFLGEVGTFVHATTRAINAILTGTTARTAFLTTAGHRDILLLREGGRLNPYDNRQPFPRPYVPRALTFEVPERIGAAGEIVRPLDEGAVLEIIGRLEALEVEAVGVCLLWSIANSAHERRIGDMLAARLPGVPFTLSHRLNAIVREYRRASATCIDASLKPLMRHYLHGLATRLRDVGFAGRLLMVTSQGGVMEVDEAAEAPIHALNSGPAMAPVAGRHIVSRDAVSADAIVADAGGTSFDVSLVRDGRIPWTSETWLGPRFSGHMTGFPSVDVTSIGAGGGSIVRMDSAGLLHVGPESAGAEPGPACYGRGGTRATVTDCALILGLLDPDGFLGGRVSLDGERAHESLRPVAHALGASLEATAFAALEILTQNMLGAIAEITVKQGIDPSNAILIAGGGAAGFNAAAIGRRLNCRATLFPETGAALSAAGAMSSDLVFSETRIHYVRSDAPSPSAVSKILEELRASATAFLAGSGAAGSSVDYWVEARYPQQTWEIEVPVAWPRADGAIDLAALVSAFHASHHALYAVSDPASSVEFIAWRVRASAHLGGAAEARLASGVATRGKDRRRIFLGDDGWSEVPLHRFDAIPSDRAVYGPALIESSLTTILVPQGCQAQRLLSGSIEVLS
jgi:N-methylhydantoinase A